jgi:hypothetical protein
MSFIDTAFLDHPALAQYLETWTFKMLDQPGQSYITVLTDKFGPRKGFSIFIRGDEEAKAVIAAERIAVIEAEHTESTFTEPECVTEARNVVSAHSKDINQTLEQLLAKARKQLETVTYRAGHVDTVLKRYNERENSLLAIMNALWFYDNAKNEYARIRASCMKSKAFVTILDNAAKSGNAHPSPNALLDTLIAHPSPNALLDTLIAHPSPNALLDTLIA